MKSALRSLAGLAAVAVVGLLVFSHLGIADLRWPWSLPDVATRATAVSVPEKPTVVEIEPISLDCRARIHTRVPVVGTREHRVLGRTYRTDTVTMTAVGDIDTCVDAGEVEILVRDDGSATVVVPAEAIRFVRPRVDAVATLDSVHYSQGLVGKLTNVFPWVSDDSQLTPAAYAYAQTVIGSSECMRDAYDTTQQAMDEAYREQMRSAGLDPDAIEVDIVGVPDFESEGTDVADLDGFGFRVDGANPSCDVAPDAFVATIPGADERPT